MKYFSAVFGLAFCAWASQAALPQPDLIASIHFAGAQKISADPHSNAFTNEFCSAEALALRTQTADKLSHWLAGWLKTNLNLTANAPDAVTKLRPLFDDLQKSEFFLEIRAVTNGQPVVAIAIRLDPTRTQLWQAGLKPFFAGATFQSADDWFIFDSNPTLLKLGARLAQKISTPSTGWFDLDINWPRLAQWYPELKELALPETQFNITAPDENFRINGKFFFPENLALNLEPWHMPTNTIHIPFNSFTAVRGFATWFQSQQWAQPYQITPVPNQLFVWSMPSFPFRTFAAARVSDAALTITQTYAHLMPVFNAANSQDAFFAPITPELSSNEISFAGMPLITPLLRAVTEPSGQYLFWETFPNTPRAKPLPPELFQRLATPKLVFYHWEITAERIPQLLNISQFGLMITSHKQLEAESAALKWVQKTGGALGNTDTEIIESDPLQFTFTRKAPGLFTAFELFVLANWLEATNFPGFNLKLPPHNSRQKHVNSKHFQFTTPIPATNH